MTRHFGVSASYDYDRRHFQTPRTQREAGIEHFEWEHEKRITVAQVLIVASGIFIVLGAGIALLT